MRTSNSKISVVESPIGMIHSESDQHTLYLSYVLLVFICAFILSLWLMQHSINAYIQQTYHRESPLVQLENYKLWRLGGDIGLLLNQNKQNLDDQFESVHQLVIKKANTWVLTATQQKAPSILVHVPHTLPQAPPVVIGKAKDPSNTLQVVQAQPIADEAVTTLSDEDQVLFVGDSLMQGVAPHVQKQLNEQYQIKTTNLSKQSTGLTYTKLFDWPATVKQVFKQQSHIKLMVVFLGPNDPWDMYDATQKKWLTFGTDAWAAAYQKRMGMMIDDAKQQGAHILWLNPPNMGKPDLNEKMQFLIQVIQQKAKQENIDLIDTRQVLSETDTQYRPTLQTAQGLKKLRTADGIHFTAEGQKMIAAEILKHIKVVSHD